VSFEIRAVAPLTQQHSMAQFTQFRRRLSSLGFSSAAVKFLIEILAPAGTLSPFTSLGTTHE
jgi:hypothetical protein